MRLVSVISSILLTYAGAIQAQTILNQFSVPFAYQQFPFFESSQFAAPDGSGGLLLFSPTENALHRFDSTGKQLWSVTVNFGSAQGVVATMAVAADGVLLGGQVAGALAGQTSAGSYDAFVAKYDWNGNSLWTNQFGTSNAEYTRAITVSPTGVYILGISLPSQQLFIRLVDANGREIWTQYFTDTSIADITGAAADSTGVYFFGETHLNVLRKFDSSGKDAWTYAFGQFAILTSAAADGQGVYLSYFDNIPGAGLISRMDSSGNNVWTRQVNASQTSNLVFTDGSGVYLAGAVNGGLPGQCYAGEGDIFIRRFDAAGDLMWTREFGTAAAERALQLSTTNSSVYVSSFTNNAVSLITLSDSSSVSLGSRPSILNECVLNAASFIGGGVAPGEIVTVIGSGLGPAQLVRLQPTAAGQIATTLGGAQILFNGEPAPLLYVSDGQSSAIVPYDVAGQTQVKVQVQYHGALSAPVTLPVFESRLGIFTFGSGSGQAAVINQDGTVNSPSNPAAAGSAVSIFATGGGLPNSRGSVNQLTDSGTSSLPDLVTVRLYDDGSDPDFAYPAATVLYYGSAPGAVPGLLQINAQLPTAVPPSNAARLFVISSATGDVEQAISIAIR